MKTTENILVELATERAEHVAAGRTVEVQRVEQAATAHMTLARLREERAQQLADGHTARAADLAEQIRFWRRQVDVDVDEPGDVDERAGVDELAAGDGPPSDGAPELGGEQLPVGDSIAGAPGRARKGR